MPESPQLNPNSDLARLLAAGYRFTYRGLGPTVSLTTIDSVKGQQAFSATSPAANSIQVIVRDTAGNLIGTGLGVDKQAAVADAAANIYGEES